MAEGSDGTDGGGMQSIERPTLRVWATVGEAYAIWFANLGLWLKLLIVPFLVAVGMIVLHVLSWVDAANSGDQAPVLPAVTAILLFVFLYLSEIPLATAWHRLILLPDPSEPRRYIVGHREMRYLLKAIFIFIVVMLISFLLGLLLSGVFIPVVWSSLSGGISPEKIWLISIFGFVMSTMMYAVLGYFLGCLFLMLPAAAIGRNLSSGEAAAAIKGNEWRLVGVYMATLLPIYFVAFVIDSLIGLASQIPVGSGGFFTFFATLIFAPVIVGVLSIVFREQVQKPEAAENAREVGL